MSKVFGVIYRRGGEFSFTSCIGREPVLPEGAEEVFSVEIESEGGYPQLLRNVKKETLDQARKRGIDIMSIRGLD